MCYRSLSPTSFPILYSAKVKNTLKIITFASKLSPYARLSSDKPELTFTTDFITL